MAGVKVNCVQPNGVKFGINFFSPRPFHSIPRSRGATGSSGIVEKRYNTKTTTVPPVPHRPPQPLQPPRPLVPPVPTPTTPTTHTTPNKPIPSLPPLQPPLPLQSPQTPQPPLPPGVRHLILKLFQNRFKFIDL